MAEKTWVDLLGRDIHRVMVYDNAIVRNVEGNKYKVLWTFADQDQATKVFLEWAAELSALPVEDPPRKLWKTTMEIVTKIDPRSKDVDYLADQSENGEGLCISRISSQVLFSEVADRVGDFFD